MKVYFPGNTKANKAMMILASMSPDMVDDIVTLCTTQGRRVVTLAAENDGAPKPLSLMSRAYIGDEDFPAVWVGATTVMLADFRTLNHDNDFYEKTLMDAFSMPKLMAADIAKKIDTIDSIGGSTDSRAAMSWWSKLYHGAQEYARRGVNTIPTMLGLPYENDQDQQYDIDYLYELKLLGNAVDELASRARLIKGQATINMSLGLFKSSAGDIYKGLIGGGDVADVDPVTVAELEYYHTAQPLTSNRLPDQAYGGLGGFVGKALKFAETNLKKYIQKASGEGNERPDPVKAAALTRIEKGPEGPSSLADGVRKGIPVSDLAEFVLRYAQGAEGGNETGDVYGSVAETYGDDVAQKWQMGDIEGTLAHIINNDDEPMPSTGDPDYDQELVESAIGDVDTDDLPKEIGGLFSRLRAKHKIKSAIRKRGKRLKFQARQQKKINRQNDMRAADNFAEQEATYAPDFNQGYGIQNPQNYADQLNSLPQNPTPNQINEVFQQPQIPVDYMQGMDFQQPTMDGGQGNELSFT